MINLKNQKYLKKMILILKLKKICLFILIPKRACINLKSQQNNIKPKANIYKPLLVSPKNRLIIVNQTLQSAKKKLHKNLFQIKKFLRK
jgi:hypothetical protein